MLSTDVPAAYDALVGEGAGLASSATGYELLDGSSETGAGAYALLASDAPVNAYDLADTDAAVEAGASAPAPPASGAPEGGKDAKVDKGVPPPDTGNPCAMHVQVRSGRHHVAVARPTRLLPPPPPPAPPRPPQRNPWYTPVE